MVKSYIYSAISIAFKGALYPGNASSNISVWTAPIANTLKDIFCDLYYSANNSVRVITAPLLELYADKPGNFILPWTPPIELIVTTWALLLK